MTTGATVMNKPPSYAVRIKLGRGPVVPMVVFIILLVLGYLLRIRRAAYLDERDIDYRPKLVQPACFMARS